MTQNLKQFMTSKTNFVSIASICLSIYGFRAGLVTFGEMQGVITLNLSAMGIRDAIAK